MVAGRIARQNGSDGIDLQIKFSFTVTPVPLRGNGVNSPARLHRLGSLKRAGSRLILANLPKSCSINIAAMQRFSLATELRTSEGCWTGWEISLYKQPSILENCPPISGHGCGTCRALLRKLRAENVLGRYEVDVCPLRTMVIPGILREGFVRVLKEWRVSNGFFDEKDFISLQYIFSFWTLFFSRKRFRSFFYITFRIKSMYSLCHFYSRQRLLGSYFYNI